MIAPEGALVLPAARTEETARLSVRKNFMIAMAMKDNELSTDIEERGLLPSTYETFYNGMADNINGEITTQGKTKRK